MNTKITSIVEELIAQLEEAGIKVPVVHGDQNAICAYDSVRGTDAERTFAEIFCSYTNRKEWIVLGHPNFYKTGVWLRARYFALAMHGNKCQCCGAGPATGAVLHVDHIKPKSKHPELSLTIDNLQVLCADCNLGKSNKDDTDWRPAI